MRMPKGFGRSYFSLTAIQATVTAITLHSITVATQFLSDTLNFSDETCDIDDPLLIDLAPLTLISEPDQSPYTNSCHCNCHYQSKTRNIFLSLYAKYRPKFTCRNLLTGISPPLSTF